MRARSLLKLVALATALSACGGSSDKPSPNSGGGADGGEPHGGGSMDGGTSFDDAGNPITPGRDGGGGDGSVKPGMSGLDSRPANTCRALPRPVPQGGSITTQPLPGTGFPTALTDMKRGPSLVPAWFAVAKNGELIVLPDGAAKIQQLAVASTFPTLRNEGEQGVLGLAVDPAYPNANAPNIVRLFVNYVGACPSSSDHCSRIRRIDLSFSGAGANMEFADATCDATRCEDLMYVRRPASNHNGGAMLFGQDGYLYFTFGDGGNDGACNSQNGGSPNGKLLRIDVHDTNGAPYAIPATNPFASNPKCDNHVNSPQWGADLSRDAPCPEIVAAGLRNPWRISQDPVTGHIWIGDVGDESYEEVNSFDPSSLSAGITNFGWPRREGPSAQPAQRGWDSCEEIADEKPSLLLPQTFQNPRFYYRTRRGETQDESLGTVVQPIGVYRGTALGERFIGTFLLSDIELRDIYVIKNPYERENLQVRRVTASNPDDPDYFANLGALPSQNALGYSADEHGELIEYGYHAPNRLVLSGGSPSRFPEDLVDTGCVDPNDPSRPVAGMIPYDVQAPLWSDDAEKERYVGIPDGTTISYAGNCAGLTPAQCEAIGDFELPIGSVVMKIFRREGVLLETRLLMRHDDGDWGGYTYVWNDAQTRATLITDATEVAGRNWTAPSRDQCLSCHTAAAGRTLGLEAAQLNREFTYPSTGRTANQLDTWASIGLLDRIPKPVEQLPQLAAFSAGGADAARAYLHANCSHCHRPGTSVPSPMDLRFSTPFASMNICEARALEGDVRLLVPGDPEASFISRRVKSTQGDERMPPLGTVIVDDEGSALIDAWISGINACP